MNHLSVDENHQYESLICIYVQYKIFLAQLNHHRRANIWFEYSVFIAAVVAPLVSRVYDHYMKRRARIIWLLVSYVIIAFCDLILLLLCYMESRFGEVCKELSVLLAQVVDKMSDKGGGGEIFDPHLVHVLRREFDRPDQFKEQTTVRLFGTPLTYINLMRVHFYCSLLLMSTIFTGHGGNEKETTGYAIDRLFDPDSWFS